MSMVGFPLLLIPLAIYNIIVFLMPGVSLAEPLFALPLMSGAQWSFTLSDVLLALGILMVLFEVIKGARPGAKYLTDHLLSLIVLGGAAAEFLLWPRFANSTFFLLTLLALVDFLSGIALRTRRGARAAASVAHQADPIAAETRREPDVIAVMPRAPVSEPAAEPAFTHRETHSEPAAVASPAEEVSPGLLPGNEAPKPPEALR